MFDARAFRLLLESAMGDRNKTEFADATDVNRTYLSKYLNEKLDKPPGPDIIKKIANKAHGGVTYQDLLVAAGYLSEELIKGKIVKIIEKPEFVRLPVVGTVAAGTPILAEENIEEHIDFPAPLAKNATFALRVRGDSMEGVGIQEGDIVLVKQQPEAENGQIVIARVDGEVTCKRFYKMDSKVSLEPANGKYKPIESDRVEIVGVVVSATRMFG